MTQYTDLMIDIETLDTRPTAKIIQLGAYLFNADKQNQNGIGFIANTVCTHPSYTESPDTLKWWEDQSDAAKKGLRHPHIETIRMGLLDLINGLDFHMADEKYRVWAKGADFDFPIVKNAFETEFGEDYKLPWKYSHQNCCRTVFKLFPEIIPIEPTIAHNAMRDAKAQAQTIQNIYAHIAKLRGAT